MQIELTAFPYDSEVIRYESDGMPVYDRAITSKEYRNLFLKYFTEGVFPNPSDNFQIVENSSQGALVKKGYANVRGVLIELKQDTPITFEQADSLDRIDRVVLRHNDTKSVRYADVVILKGSPSNSPQAPNITRDETIWDIVLADVRIRKNSSNVTQAQITDRRLDSELCGIVAGTIKEVDTTTLYNQIQSDLSQFKENEQTEFLEWFESIKGKLGEDLAGNLQLQIDDLDSRTGILEEATFTGEFTQIESEFSGITGDNGIEVARIEGAYKQDGTPTPEQPIEPQFFHATTFNTNGGNLFDASKLPTKSQGGATVTNNSDGSFTISGSGNLTEIFQSIYNFSHEDIISIFKSGDLFLNGVSDIIPYFDVYFKNTSLGDKQLNNNNKKITLDNDYLSDSGTTGYIAFYGRKDVAIKTGTIKPVLYQDGNGTFYPFNASSTPVDIELRALPNGVKDTYENGIITRRVGFVEFDGSQTAMSIIKNSDGTYRVSFQLEKYTVDKDKYFTNSLCDKATQLEGGGVTSLSSGKFIVGGFKEWGGKRVVISVPSNVSTLELAKKYFTDNPYRVWYELKKPITEPINIPFLKSFYPFTNAWCDSELQSNITWNVLTGRSSILDGLENVIKEAPMTAPQSLIINGDFQCWQRGDTLTIKNAEYGPDCWRSYALNATGITIEKVDNGMKIKSLSGASTCNFYQYITDKNLNGKKAMFAYSVNDKITSKLLTLNLSSGKDNQCSINDLKVNDIVNWAHLYLGEINYEHQKEDKTVALMRCSPFIERAKFTVTATGSYFMNGFSYKMAKENNPIINVLSVANSDGAVNKADFSFAVIDKYFANFIRYKGGSCASLNNNVYTFEVLLTCETL